MNYNQKNYLNGLLTIAQTRLTERFSKKQQLDKKTPREKYAQKQANRWSRVAEREWEKRARLRRVKSDRISQQLAPGREAILLGDFAAALKVVKKVVKKASR